MTLEPLAIIAIAAIIFGPTTGALITLWITRRRSSRDLRLWIFKELMATRYERLSRRHCDALNAVDLVFCKRPRVASSLRIYLDHMNHHSNDAATWIQRGDDLFYSFLYAMSKDLGYKFDIIALRRVLYYPEAWNMDKAAQENLYKALLDNTIAQRSAISDGALNVRAKQ